MIICVTGLTGSGKGSVGKILGEMGFRVYDLGDEIREMMKESGMEISPENDKKFTIGIRKRYGKLVVVKHLLKKIKLGSAHKTAILGIRSNEELDCIRKRAKAVSVAVVAPVRTRFERAMKRGRPDSYNTLAAFVKNKDEKDAGMGMLDVIKGADYVIANTSTHTELKKSVGLMLSQIKG